MTDPVNKYRRQVLKTVGVGSSATLVGLAGCLGDDGEDDTGAPEDDDDDTAVADGDDDEDLEDEMQLYSAFPIDDLVGKFNDEYGVEVTVSTYVGPETISRVQAEGDAGDMQASAALTTVDGVEWMEEHIAEVEMPDANQDRVLREDLREEIEELGVWQKAWPILEIIRATPYNTNVVDDPPVEYDEFLDDQYDDMYVTSATNMRRVHMTLTRAGWSDEEATEHCVGLHESMGTYVGSMPASVEAIVDGRADIGAHVMTSFLRPQFAAGAPVDVVYPPFVSGHYNAIGVTEEAPSPNLARKFCEWVTSEAGQRSIADDLGFNPLDPDIEHGFPELAERLAEWDPEVIPVAPSAEENDRVDDTLREAIGDEYPI